MTTLNWFLHILVPSKKQFDTTHVKPRDINNLLPNKSQHLPQEKIKSHTELSPNFHQLITSSRRSSRSFFPQMTPPPQICDHPAKSFSSIRNATPTNLGTSLPTNCSTQTHERHSFQKSTVVWNTDMCHKKLSLIVGKRKRPFVVHYLT